MECINAMIEGLRLAWALIVAGVLWDKAGPGVAIAAFVILYCMGRKN